MMSTGTLDTDKVVERIQTEVAFLLLEMEMWSFTNLEYTILLTNSLALTSSESFVIRFKVWLEV